MNLVATAHDKRVTINGRSVVIAAGGWPADVAKVEWFGQAGVVTFADGSAERFTDDAMLVPLIVAWRVAGDRAAQKKMGWREKLANWLRSPDVAR